MHLTIFSMSLADGVTDALKVLWKLMILLFSPGVILLSPFKHSKEQQTLTKNASMMWSKNAITTFTNLIELCWIPTAGLCHAEFFNELSGSTCISKPCTRASHRHTVVPDNNLPIEIYNSLIINVELSK